ncbi:MAG: ester cyclase [Deltaproteobacteria bacterium]|nr:ester cyclase [Deltaproteobacteria bacterium]
MAELEELKAKTELEEQNRALVEKYIEGWNSKNIQILDEFLDPQFQVYIPSNTQNPMSLEQFKGWIEGLFQAFPDIQYDIQEIFVTGDKVCLRWTCTATYKGGIPGIPATEKKVVGSAIEIYRVQNGKIIEERSEMDAQGWNQQLGL